MEKREEFWEMLTDMPLPPLDEVEQIVRSLPGEIPEITEQYVAAQRLYGLLFGALFLQKSGLDRLDRRLQKRNYRASDEDEMDFFQQYSLLGLHYFYLWTLPRIERLMEDEYRCLTECLETKEKKTLLAAEQMVEATWKQIMAVQPSEAERWFELFPAIHGEGRVQGKQIVLVMKSTPTFDEQGNILDEAANQERIGTMYNVKEQLEPILAGILENMQILVEV